MKILSIYGAVLFESATAKTIADALTEAVSRYADLRSANLSYANLRYADLSSAGLSFANLSSANLRSANLRSANLSFANLSSADLRSADLSSAGLSSANLSSADLRYANLSSANLSSAELRSAELRYANLSSANLSYADLSSADLSSANLSYADLSSAVGISKYMTSPLYMLLDQPGTIRAYKLVTKDGTGPAYPGVRYEIGKTLAIQADTDENNSCSYGINIATLDWVMREWSEGMRILLVEHTAEDIACIPLGTDGKYRVSRCKVVAEKDLKELGLVKS